MFFSIIIILMAGIVAFFHYVQGFFSATISAMIAVLAAALAISYHEPVVALLLKGKMADYAHAMVLCMLFIVTYIFLRVIFDMAIPGNVRTPSIVDKVGAGLMGLVAGVCCSGIFAIAVQMLPFDPGISFLGYGRYPLVDTRKVVVPSAGGRNFLDTHIDNEMVEASLDPEKEKGLLLPSDDWVLDIAYHLSDGGSLSGDRTLASIHPDYLQELFGQRLGIQTSARRVALELNGNNPIDVKAVYTAASFPVKDGAVKEVRPAGFQPLYKGEVKSNAGQQILVVRIKVAGSATDDEDTYFRFSTGAMRIVGPASDGKFKNFYPIGTLYNANTVLLNKPDDFLFVKANDSFDAVFVVDSSLLAGAKLAPGVFINVKRFGLQDLAGQPVLKGTITGDASTNILLPAALKAQLSLPDAAAPTAPTPAITPSPAGTPAATPTPTTPTDNTPATPQPTPGKEISQDISASVSDTLASSISLGTNVTDRDAKDAPVASGKISLQGGLISQATVDPSASISQLSQGANTYTQLFAPQGKVLVQVQFQPYTGEWQEWMSQWGKTVLVDTNGNTITPSGCYAQVKGGDAKALYLRYSFDSVVSLSPPDGTPDGSIYLIFQVLPGTEVKSLTIGGKTQNLGSTLKVP